MGCVVLRSAVWIDSLAAALQSVPERDRAAYSAIKAIELLYLISTDSPLLTIPPESVSRDHYLTDTVRQVLGVYGIAPVRPALRSTSSSARFRHFVQPPRRIYFGRPMVVRSTSICLKSGCSMLPNCCIGVRSPSWILQRRSAITAPVSSVWRSSAAIS